LATQIYEVLTKFAVYHVNIQCGLFIGGTSITDNSCDYDTNGIQVMIGTPGRILDIKNRTGEKFNFKKLEVLVLDEADTLLALGFKDNITSILSMLPKQRRTGLFSATQTKEVKELARAGLRNPVSISVKIQNNGSDTRRMENQVQATPSTLANWYTVCEHEERPIQLARFLLQHLTDKVIVFCSTCACVDYYSLAFEQLAKLDVVLPSSLNVVGFHGKMVPKKRNGLYKRFLSLDAGVMFSTDVAARGVDIPDVNWIVQLAAPKDPAFFVHRVGRTARAGRVGGALIYVNPEEVPYVELLRGRGVPLQEREKLLTNGEAGEGGKTYACENILTAMKELAMKDRELLETGSTAFMSFLRAYKENLCSYIFRLDLLDIGGVARSYALLKLPKIPETRGVKGKPVVFETTKCDTSKIPYRHKEKEAARVRRLAASLEEERLEKEAIRVASGIVEGDDDDANSDVATYHTNATMKSQTTSRTGTTSRREKHPEKWIAPEEYKTLDDPKRKRKKKESFQQKVFDEWDELAAEEMAYKKFKKGKITKEEYDNCLTSDRAMEIDPVTGGPQLEGGRDLALGSDDDSDGEVVVKKKKVKFEGGSDDESDSDDSEAPKKKTQVRKAAAPSWPSNSSSSIKSYNSRGSAGSNKTDYRKYKGTRAGLFNKTGNSGSRNKR
jgi:ATP-dependent RNA helicase DDX55/SPB4